MDKVEESVKQNEGSLVKENAEESLKQNGQSALQNQKKSINEFVGKLSKTIIELMYKFIDLIILIFLIFIINVFNEYIKDSFWQFISKFLCICIAIFIYVKFFGVIYENILNKDKRKLAFMSCAIFILDLICVLLIFNIINQETIPNYKLIIFLTLPLLIMNVAIIIDDESIVPLVIILLAFVAGIVVFTLAFFVDFDSWKSPLMIASVVYMIFGLFCVIKLILYYFMNKSEGESDAKGNIVKSDIEGRAEGIEANAKGDPTENLTDKLQEIK
jgi:hypothetical protein